MSEDTEQELSVYDKAIKFVDFVKNLGIIIGVPAIIVVGFQIRDAQDELFRSEISYLKTQIQGLEAQKYDNALTVIESQEKVYQREKDQLKKSILMVGGGELKVDDFLSSYMCLKLNPKPEK